MNKKRRLLFRNGLAISMKPIQRSRHMEICMGYDMISI